MQRKNLLLLWRMQFKPYLVKQENPFSHFLPLLLLLARAHFTTCCTTYYGYKKKKKMWNSKVVDKQYNNHICSFIHTMESDNKNSWSRVIMPIVSSKQKRKKTVKWCKYMIVNQTIQYQGFNQGDNISEQFNLYATQIREKIHQRRKKSVCDIFFFVTFYIP